jgi:hypothetical protein
VAPYLVLFDLFKDGLVVAGHAFAIDSGGNDVLTHVAHWDSAVSHIDGRGSAAVEMSYIYSGPLTAQVDGIKGVSNLGLSEYSISNPKARAGYICDLKIPAGELGLIRDVDTSVRAFRIVTVRFDDKRFQEFARAVPKRRPRLLMSIFKISSKVPEDVFERFLKDFGLDFLVGAEMKGHESWRKIRIAIESAAAKCQQVREKALGNARDAEAVLAPADAKKLAPGLLVSPNVDAAVAADSRDSEVDRTG